MLFPTSDPVPMIAIQCALSFDLSILKFVFPF
jgi:hypothetical protein